MKKKRQCSQKNEEIDERNEKNSFFGKNCLTKMPLTPIFQFFWPYKGILEHLRYI
jgi:hypothetical protein